MSTESVKTDVSRPTTRSFLWSADALAVQWQDFLLLVGRVLIGWIFVQSGWRKLMDMNVFIYEGPNSLVARGVPGAGFWGWIGAPLEFIGGLAILFGFASRYAALAILIFTIAATLIAHRYWEFTVPAQRQAQHTQFFKNLSMMGGLIVLFVAGTGRYAVDTLLRRRMGS
jgi:putative oxidoreductase